MKRKFVVTVALALLCLGSLAQAAITIETVPVGDPGNAADSTGYGSVGYDYNIGRYEVTALQYTRFLNAVAATDTYALYNTAMSNSSYGSGIWRDGVSGSYNYGVSSLFINRPVNCVSWGDCARFANWLHNGQPTGLQDASTTEDGTYYLNGATTDAALNAVTRKAGGTWAITSEDEWYKAAYYKGDGTSAGYWLYPTSSDTTPLRDLDDVSGNNANFYGSCYPIIPGKYTTIVGEFQNSDSPYGTFDQGGNVFEWNEALINADSRGIRGGSYYGSYSNLRATNRNNYFDPTHEDSSVGFRVVQAVPEPSSIIALAGGLASLLCLMRRRIGLRPAA